MGTNDFSQVPLVVPTPLEAAKYIATSCQDNLNPVFYISIKGGFCVYTWDRGFLVSYDSLGVWEMGWLHENHWVMGDLHDGSGLLEAEADSSGLLEVKADVWFGCV